MGLDLLQHLGTVDHGIIAGILGDARLVELIKTVENSRIDLERRDRGRIILETAGGSAQVFEDRKRRNAIFLSLSSSQRDELKSRLNVVDLDSFNLTATRRGGLYEWFGLEQPPHEKRVKPHSVFGVGCNYGLFPHQTNALLSCLSKLTSDVPKVMLHMPTGSGKTRTAMHLMCRHLNQRKSGVVVWLVAGVELCGQAASEFRKAWSCLGDRPLPVSCIWSDCDGVNNVSFQDAYDQTGRIIPHETFHCSWPESLDDGVIIGSLDSMRSITQGWEPGELQRRAEHVSLIVFDEAHRSVAPTYRSVIDCLYNESKCGLLGLSATPGRAHFEGDTHYDTELTDLFGGNMVQLTIDGYVSPVEALIAKKFLAKIDKEQLKVPDSGLTRIEIEKINRRLEKDLDLPVEALRSMGLSAARNLKIVERVEKLILDEEHQRVIVFAPSVESSNLISCLLSARKINAASVTARTDSKSRAEYICQFRNQKPTPMVLCNYGVLTTGFDAPKTSAVVIARPTKSIVLLSQMAGRAIRGKLVGGNSEAKIVTVVDVGIPELVNTVEQFHAFDDAWRNQY